MYTVEYLNSTAGAATRRQYWLHAVLLPVLRRRRRAARAAAVGEVINRNHNLGTAIWDERRRRES